MHRRYQLKTPKLVEQLEHHATDPAPLDLTAELALARIAPPGVAREARTDPEDGMKLVEKVTRSSSGSRTSTPRITSPTRSSSGSCSPSAQILEFYVDRQGHAVEDQRGLVRRPCHLSPRRVDWSYDGGVLDAPLLAPSDPWAQALAEVFGDTSPTLAPEDLANGVLEPAPRMPLRQFVEQAWPILEPEALFIPNWHVDAICAHLEAVIDGRIRRLVINVPPGFMKSLLVCVFWPAWVWTFRPGWRGIFSSYAGDLAIRDSVKCRALIESEWYRGTFAPSWQLSSDQNVKSYFQNTRMGFRLSLSVGGKGTGFRGHCVVVDDPLNVRDGFSDLALDEVVRWWDKTMSTRQRPARRRAHRS
jgi:hypothetical protein